MTVRDLLASATHVLTRARIPDPRREAESLLAHALGQDAAWIVAHPDAPISKMDGRPFLKSVEKRGRGIPFAYVVGEKWFYGRRFRVTDDVLIPRPETELLVEAVLSFCHSRGGGNSEPLILDVGTGSGAVGLTLAAELPDSKAVLYDISKKALTVARSNARDMKLGLRVRLPALDILRHPLPEPKGRFTIIAANLPYLPTAVWKKAAPEVRRHEPKLALVSGPDGLRHYRALFKSLARWKRPPDVLALEAEPEQFAELRRLARTLMPRARIDVIKDIHGDDRVLVAVK